MDVFDMNWKAVAEFLQKYPSSKTTRKVKVLSLPETIKQNSTFRAKALRRELAVGVGEKLRVFLYELIQKHHVTK